jgi:hypothetical protein
MDGVTPWTGASLRLRTIPAIAACLGLFASLLAACSATPASSSQPAASAPTVGSASPTVALTPEPTAPAPTTPAPTPPAPSGPVAIREGKADAGTYTTTSFKPTVQLTLPSDGWRFFFTDDDDEMAMGKGAVEFTGGRVANVLDATHKVVPAPDDLVSWLAAHPRLEAGTPQPATIGGIVGQSIDVKNTDTSDVDIFAYPTGNLRVAANTTARIWVLPYEGPDIVFTGFALSSFFEESLPTMQQIVDSIVITPS